jgi:cytochrome c peroxidase
MLKAPKTKRLKLEYDELLSSFALNFNLRRYTAAADEDDAGAESVLAHPARQVQALLRRAVQSWVKEMMPAELCHDSFHQHSYPSRHSRYSCHSCHSRHSCHTSRRGFPCGG